MTEEKVLPKQTVNEIAVPYSPSASQISSELKPFVKWAGGKRQLLSTFRQFYPAELGTSLTKYAEPFVGGGAVLFDVLQTYKFDEIYISDVNYELVNTYTIIRNKPEELISLLSDMKKDYLPKSEEERNKAYYTRRARYNELKLGKDTNPLEMAALFIFLNKTCFNGLYRVSPKTGFNVPIGKYKNPAILEEENIRNISLALHNVKIVCEDFTNALDFIDEKTFVYIDPPYRPLSTTASFTSYAEGDFNDEEQIRLAEFAKTINEKQAKFLLSNSDPKNTNPKDDFFDDLYKDFNIHRIEASRCINSKGTGRGKISELLISNY